MSHFYGILDNSVNKQITRRGFKNHGIFAQVQSYNTKGTLFLFDEDGKDKYRVQIHDRTGRIVKEVEWTDGEN